MLAAATIIVVTAGILARVVSNSGMSKTNATIVVFRAIVATGGRSRLRVRRDALLMRAMSVEASKNSVDALGVGEGEELEGRAARMHFAALPFADERLWDVQRQGEGRLAHMSLLADLPDRFGRQFLYGRQATKVKVTHRGLVDRADLVEVPHHLVKRLKRGGSVGLRPGHISNSLHPRLALRAVSSLSVSFANS